MLFKPNDVSIEFKLIHLECSEFEEIREVIEKNGGVICDESRIIFTNNKTCMDMGYRDVFDVNYIRECVRRGQLLELLDFKIADQVVRSCWTEILIDKGKHCSNTITYLNPSQLQMCRNCKWLIMDNQHNEHNYVRRLNNAKTLTAGQLNRHHDFYTLKKTAMSPKEGISDIQSSKSMDNPEDDDHLSYTQSQLRDTNQDSNKERTLQTNEQNEMLENSLDEIPSSSPKIDQRMSMCNINDIYPLSAAEEEVEGEFHEDLNVTKQTSNKAKETSDLSKKRLHETQNVSPQLCSTIPRCQKICLEQPVAGPSIVTKTVFVTESSESSTDSYKTCCQTPGSNWQPRKKFTKKIERLKHGVSPACSKIQCVKNCPPSQDQPGPSGIELILLDSDDESISRESVVSVSSESDTEVVKRKMSLRTYTRHKSNDKNRGVTIKKSIDRTSRSDEDSDGRDQRPAPAAIKKRIQNHNSVSRNFLFWEQKEMIKYLIDTESIHDAKGNRVWKRMIQDGHLTHRTYQSLNNHFRRFIVPKLGLFNMDPKSRRLFEKLKY